MDIPELIQKAKSHGYELELLNFDMPEGKAIEMTLYTPDGLWKIRRILPYDVLIMDALSSIVWYHLLAMINMMDLGVKKNG